MPTETQKNFRKQMQMLEKELNEDKEKQGFYSYIERDYINSYYSKKGKKKAIITTISIGSILFVLWNSYAVLTWIAPVVDSITEGKLKSLTGRGVAYDGINYKDGVQQEVAYYLQGTNEINHQLIDYYKLRNDILDSALKSDSRKQYIQSLKTYTESVLGLIFQLQCIDPPAQMDNYHALVLSNYESSYKSFLYAEECLDTSDNSINNCINKFNEAVAECNAIDIQVREEMLKVFNDIGMSYYEKDGLIHYSWKQ